MNSYTDLEKLELYAQQIHDSGIDITPDQKNEWTMIAYACASQGEAGREPYHLICSNYPGYSREECDRHFSYCLKTSKNCVGLGSLVKIAKDHGLELKLPRGRRPTSPAEAEEKQANKIIRITEELNTNRQWRYNVLTDKPEFKDEGKDWQPMDDRSFDTIITKLRMMGLGIQDKALKSLIGSSEFSCNFNPVEAYLNSLPDWNPETDPDYIHETFIGHMEFKNPEDTEFYDRIFHHYMVGKVMLWLRKIKENPTMPVLNGPHGIGKTYFCRGLLPPELECYVANVGPSDPVNKDTILMLSEKLLIVCEEFELTSKSKSDMFKYVTSLNKSTVRRSYDRYSEDRFRLASLIGSNNQTAFIYEPEGNRRFVGVELTGMIKLCDKPINYAGLYAQTMYLIKENFPPHPNAEEIALIAKHNEAFQRPDDCEEALLTILRKPEEDETPEVVLVGEIQKKLHLDGFHGPAYSASNIGKTLRRMGIYTHKGRRGSEAYVILLRKKGEAQVPVVQDEPKQTELPF